MNIFVAYSHTTIHWLPMGNRRKGNVEERVMAVGVMVDMALGVQGHRVLP